MNNYESFISRIQETIIRIDVTLNKFENHTDELFENFKISYIDNIDVINFKSEFLSKLILLEISLMSLASECFTIHPHANNQLKNTNKLLLKVVQEILKVQTELECFVD